MSASTFKLSGRQRDERAGADRGQADRARDDHRALLERMRTGGKPGEPMTSSPGPLAPMSANGGFALGDPLFGRDPSTRRPQLRPDPDAFDWHAAH